MFIAPPATPSRVFARIRDRYRVPGRRPVWVDAQRGGQPTGCSLEGTSFDRAGNLLVVDVPVTGMPMFSHS